MERIIYFSNVDQSDVSIQSQVEEYVNKLVDLENVVAPPLRFWIRDFKMAMEEAEKNNLLSESLSFNEQLDYFLQEYPQYVMTLHMIRKAIFGHLVQKLH